MGQAKRRGTFEQRLELALKENEVLKSNIEKLKPAADSPSKVRKTYKFVSTMLATLGVQSYKVRLQQNGQFKRKESE